MGRTKEKKPESEEQEEEQYSIAEEEEEDEQLEEPHEEEEIDELQAEHRRQLQVLQIIAAQTKDGTDGEKLTFLALYSLKQKEIELNQKMVEQINQIKDKFELLKQPFYAKLASVAVGKKVEQELYKPKGIDTSVDLKKVVPAALPDFWVTIFQKSGLVQDAQDFQAFRKLEDFQCDLLNPKNNHLRLTFKFKEEPALFSNKELSIEVSNDTTNPQKLPIVKIKEPIKFKGKQNQTSIFYQLFGSPTNAHQINSLVNEFYRDYCNSIYFYLRQDDEDIQNIIDAEEEGSEESQAKVKKSKEGKDSKRTRADVKQKPALEQPECKNQ